MTKWGMLAFVVKISAVLPFFAGYVRRYDDLTAKATRP
jgi:hypothetical protein